MDPGTAILLASVASAGSAVVSGIQAYQQGRYEADVAAQNANIAKDNAARARRDADLAEEAQRREMRKSLGRAAAAASQSGAAGGGPGSGSFGAVNTQSAKEAELDALSILYAGDTERHASLVQEAQFRAERKAAMQRAKGGLMSGVMGAASAGLSGFSDYRGYTRSQKLMGGRMGVSSTRGTPKISPYKRGP